MDEPRTPGPGAWDGSRSGQGQDSGLGGWRFERSVNLGTLLSLLTSLVVLAGLAAGVKTRLELVEDRLCRLEARIEELRAAGVKIEHMEERLRFVQELVAELREDARRRPRDGP